MNKLLALKTGVVISLVIQVGLLFNGHVIGALVTGVVLVALAVDLFKAKVELCDAHIYKHLELGTLLYCDSEQATHTDYQYLGTAKVNCKNVGSCSLS